jgi:hypothetical protein
MRLPTNRLSYGLVVCLVALASSWSESAAAQGRRAGGGRVVGTARAARPVVVRPAIRSAVIVGGGFYFADPFWYGYPWIPYWYPVGYPYPYWGFGYAYRADAAIRIEVTPKDAEVYVDGYYAGIVDDFNGVLQRLHVTPGRHEITIYKDGYRTFHQTLYLGPDSTFKLHHVMEPLQPGDVSEPRPTPPPPSASQPPPGRPPLPPRRGPVRRQPPPPPPGAPSEQTSDSGILSLRVQPGNATVLVDGEQWQGPEGSERLLIQLPEGTHHVEIRRDGFQPFSTDVTIRRGETTALNVSLRTQ